MRDDLLEELKPRTEPKKVWKLKVTGETPVLVLVQTPKPDHPVSKPDDPVSLAAETTPVSAITSYSSISATTSAPVPEKDKDMVDYEPSPPRDMDVNVIYLSASDYTFLGGDDEVAQFDFGPQKAIFEKPLASENHIKLLFVRGHVNGSPMSRML